MTFSLVCYSTATKLDYCNSLYILIFLVPKYNVFRIFKTPQLALLPRPPNSLMLYLFLNLEIHWLKIKECIHYKLLSLAYNTLTTGQPTYSSRSYLFSPRAVLVPRLSSLLLSRLHPTPIETKTKPLFSIRSIRLWNKLTNLFCQANPDRSSSHSVHLNYTCQFICNIYHSLTFPLQAQSLSSPQIISIIDSWYPLPGGLFEPVLLLDDFLFIFIFSSFFFLVFFSYVR